MTTDGPTPPGNGTRGILEIRASRSRPDGRRGFTAIRCPSRMRCRALALVSSAVRARPKIAPIPSGRGPHGRPADGSWFLTSGHTRLAPSWPKIVLGASRLQRVRTMRFACERRCVVVYFRTLATHPCAVVPLFRHQSPDASTEAGRMAHCMTPVEVRMLRRWGKPDLHSTARRGAGIDYVGSP